MSLSEAQEPDDVVRGKVFVEGFLVEVLFDSGDTHSFISPTVAKKIDKMAVYLSTPIAIKGSGG